MTQVDWKWKGVEIPKAFQRETADDREQKELKTKYERECAEHHKAVTAIQKQGYITPRMLDRVNKHLREMARIRQTYRGYSAWEAGVDIAKARDWSLEDTQNHPHVKYAIENNLYSMEDILAAVDDSLDILDMSLDQFLRSTRKACEKIDDILRVAYDELLDVLKVQAKDGLTPPLLKTINERCVNVKKLADKYHNCGKWRWLGVMQPREWTVEDTKNHPHVKYAVANNMYTLEGMVSVLNQKPAMLDLSLEQFMSEMRVERDKDNIRNIFNSVRGPPLSSVPI